MELTKIYNNLKLPSGVAGEKRLYETGKVLNPSLTLREVKQFLQSQDSYTLHKITRKKFPRRKIIAQGPGIIASMDLSDMSKLSAQNRGYKYILVFIDIFSRYLSVSLLKRKNAICVLNAVKSILESDAFKTISRIHVDKGSEFYNQKMLGYLNSRNITLYSVSSYEIKAAIAERVIQTIKRKIFKYLTLKNTTKYYNILRDIIEGYNHSPHSSLGLGQTPFQVHNLTDPARIRQQFYRMYKYSILPGKTLSSDLTLDQTVRLADKDRASKFRRGFVVQNTFEIFKIRDINKSQNPITYYLKDLAGENIDGVFYREELVPTSIPEFFPVDVLRKKRIRGKLFYLVNWRGYPSKFNSFIPATSIKS